MKLRNKIAVVLLVLLFVAGIQRNAVAQCNTNVSVCGIGGTAGPFNFSTPGSVVSSCLDFFGPNVGYIMLYITQSGSLNMQIDGSSTTGFLDVAVFNIPPGSSPCTAINNLSNEIGCNYASNSSGCNQFGTVFGCPSSVPAPSVTAGQVLMILVENWSGSSNNFTLQLASTPGSAGAGPPNATINSAGPFCSSAGASQLTAVNMGGTWSGPGTSASGMFNPATAGVGSHTINYTIGTAPCQATSSTTVQVVTTPTITVNTATICPGGTATLTATPSVAGGTYVWNPGGMTGQSIMVSPGSTATYTCTYSIGSCTSAPRTTTVTVGGAATITVNSATVCPGSSATLTASGGTSYTWAPATGLSATTGTSVTATPTSTTTYTVTNGGGCAGSATSTVTVSPGPIVTVNSPTICAGGSTALNASGASTYTWSPATGLSATTGASVTANPPTTTTYTVVGSSAASCTGTTTSTVTVNPLPVVTVNSATVCAGAAATLTASGATTYSWAPSTGLSATAGVSVSANPISNTTYTITGTTAGCNGTTTSTVAVNPIPIISSTANNNVCETMSISLSVTGANTYTWSPAVTLTAPDGSTVTASPSATTIYTVTGTTAGCNGTGSVTVTVHPLPVVTANSPTTCVGNPVAVNASGGNIYVWQPSPDLTGSGASAMANPSSTTTYTVFGTDANGCGNFASFTVTVNPLPVVTINSETICEGTSAILTANGATTYSWAPSTGLSTSTGSSVTANPTTTTTYTITGTTSGCDGIQTSTVTVNPIPAITVNSPGICVTGTATITATGATTYSWSPGIGLSATTGSSVTANPPTTTIYTITGTSLGCDGTATSTVTINAIPTVAVNSPTICANANATLTASGGSSFTWSPAIGLSATTGASVIANPPVTTTYTVTETSSGCNGTNTSLVTVNPLPTVTLSNTGPYCQNETIQINCTTSANAFIWSGPNSFSGSVEDPSITNASASHAGMYSVLVTDVNGCQATQTSLVVVNPLPVVTIGNNSPVCENGTLNLTASGGTSFSWAGPVTLPNNTLQNPSIPYATLAMSGTYTVVVTDGNGCVNANVTSVTINAEPGLPVVGTANYCLGDAATALTATASAGGTLNWYGTSPSGGYSSTATVPSTSTAGSVIYYVSQTVNGCEGSPAPITVLVRALPTGTLNSIATQCVPLTDTFTLNSASTLVSYLWDMGNGMTNTNSNTLPWSYGQSGNYDIAVTVTDNNGCTKVIPFSNWVHVTEIPTADFNYSPSPVSILDPNVTFEDYSIGSGLIAAQWNIYQGSTLLYSTDDAQPSFVFPDIDTFQVELTVVSSYGCSNTIVKPVIIQDDHAVYIPNAFSPDNDNINEVFKVEGTGIEKVKMSIFDRWGGLIFTTSDKEEGWNGRFSNNNKVEKGVYIYKVEIVDYKGSKSLKHGHVTVVR